jgi:hypothetical protein
MFRTMHHAALSRVMLLRAVAFGTRGGLGPEDPANVGSGVSGLVSQGDRQQPGELPVRGLVIVAVVGVERIQLPPRNLRGMRMLNWASSEA